VHEEKPEREETRLPMRLLVTICGLAAAAADEWSHKYKPNEDVTLWVNKVGPYHNPQETYVYYSLPFCSTKPVEQLEHRYDALGEVLEGNDLISSGLRFRYQEPVNDHSKICSMKLSEEDSAALQYAVRNHCASPPHTSNAAAAIDAPAAAAPCRRQACQHREDESALACLPLFFLRASAAAASVPASSVLPRPRGRRRLLAPLA